MELNERQKEAVFYGEGPLMVIAGAGTGKTHVLTQRIVQLIQDRKAKPEEILALTFSEKAALEMQERVDFLLPYGYADVSISTFHAFGDRMLREHALEIGLSPSFEVLTRAEQFLFLRRHLFSLPLKRYRPLGNPMKHIEALLTVISRAKDEAIMPQEYLSYAEALLEKAKEHPEDEALQEEAERQWEIAQCYAKYQELLAQAGRVDFGDQCLLALRLLREQARVRERYQDRFRYILVDEFQDTNYAQFELIKILGAKHRNITVAGDDDQSIFKFRGASFSNILSFSKVYPTCKEIVLIENYRSGISVLDNAYRLIRFNDPDRLEHRRNICKRLQSRQKFDSKVEHRHLDTLSAEADWVAQSIEERVAKGECRYQDVAILVRSNNDADPYLRALNMLGIRYRFSGSRGLYHREEIRDLIAFLRVLNDPKESVSLYRLAHCDFYGVPEADIRDLLVEGHKSHRPLIDVCRERIQSVIASPANGGAKQSPEDRHVVSLDSETPRDDRMPLSVEGRAALQTLLQDIDRYRDLSASLSTGKVLYRFLKDKGIFKRLSGEASYLADLKIQNIAQFFRWIELFERASFEDKIPQLVVELELLIASGEEPPEVEGLDYWDAVNVLTCHKAKGLEFEVVYLVSLVQGRFPWPHRSDPIEFPEALIREELPEGNFHLQEERRLFYVGMTRAKKELYLTGAENYGGQRARKVSQFVREALDLPVQKVSPQRRPPLEELSRWGATETMRVPLTELPKGVLTLSFRQIDDYWTCPLKYKYVHILRIPIAHHHSVVYGKALHDAIQYYLRAKQNGKAMSVPEIHRIFEGSWRSEGFLTREHEERRLEEGKKVLGHFYEMQEKKGLIPKYVEKEFSFMVQNDRIIGRWDRVDEDAEGVRIIDFKSSEVKNQKEADRKAGESLQLSIYALAYQRCFGKLPDEVSLYFLESGILGRRKPSESDLAEAVQRIEEASQGIRKGDFKAKPTYLACSYCAYQEICPATAKLHVDSKGVRKPTSRFSVHGEL